MKKLVILTVLTLFSIACGNTAETTNTNISINNSSDSQIISSHSETVDNTAQNTQIVPKSETKTMWTQSGTPIDVKEYNAKVEKAEKDFKSKPKDEAAKKNLSEAYTARAVALTEARQYASALGDFRRALKYDAANEEAKSGRDVILSIYKSMNREFPPEGEEPPPLPFGKSTETSPKNSAEKVEFETGATSKVVTGDLNDFNDSKSFLINVKEDQTLRTEQIKDKNSSEYITVAISDPAGKYVGDSDASCNNRKEIKPTVAGDYQITVTECKKADSWRGEFKLKISIL
ncbi:MAG: hypothetical protein ABI686_09885 [Acidobacteriota bacterium]